MQFGFSYREAQQAVSGIPHASITDKKFKMCVETSALQKGDDMTQIAINQPIDVTAFLFNKQAEALPRRIEFNGRTLTFNKQNIIKNINSTDCFDASDDNQIYRIKEQDKKWTLLEIIKL